LKKSAGGDQGAPGVCSVHKRRTSMAKKDEDKELELVASFGSSTVSDVEYDIIKELQTLTDSIEKSLDETDMDGVRDKFPYLRHLIDDLEEVLSGDFKNLRYRRFITKKTL
jgi:hypothetical protein